MPPKTRNSASIGDSDDEHKDEDTHESNDKKLIPYSKQLPMLGSENFVEFKAALENLAYYAGWHEETLDLKLTSPTLGTVPKKPTRQGSRNKKWPSPFSD